MARSRGRIIAWVTAAVVLTIGLSGGALYKHLTSNVPVTYSDPMERFKYGSIGTEVLGLPAHVFEVLPEICPDKFPGGYEKLGFIYEEGRPLPIGLSQREMGVVRSGFNCALCHTGTYREAKDAKPHIVPGMPPQRLDFERFLQSMMGCVLDPRFTADNVMAKIQARHELSALDAAVYRYLAVPKVLDLITLQAKRFAYLSQRPEFGPGRADALNIVKLNLGLEPGKDDQVATVDYPAIWNQAAHKGHYANWDGATPEPHERNIISASASSGGDMEALDDDEMRWIEGWLSTLPPPVYPFDVDEQLAQKGEPIFQQQCADCHAPSGKRVGLPTLVSEVGTDPNRTNIATPDVITAINKIRTPHWQVKGFRTTNGYATTLLDGIWARAPYLHNGSVPNLRELLEKPENRSKVFYRGYDVYDPKNVGFVSSGPDAEREGRKFDTAVKGNGNAGHLYGTELAPEDKQALIEYLKRQDKNVK